LYFTLLQVISVTLNQTMAVYRRVFCFLPPCSVSAPINFGLGSAVSFSSGVLNTVYFGRYLLASGESDSVVFAINYWPGK